MKVDAEEHLSDIERGRQCYVRRAWGEAYEALTRADSMEALPADDLERLAWSAAYTARDDELLRLLERLHQVQLEGGDCLGAARAAFWLGFRLTSLGEMARSSGWFARAQRLIETEPPTCALRGYLIVPVAFRHFLAGEFDAAHRDAGQAVEIGERCGDRDLVIFARHVQGLALVRKERVEEGLALLDETMVAVTTGELSPLLTGLIYCGVIACCQRIYALNRAREWTAALTSWCQSQPQLVTFTGKCLVHRSEILQLNGDWPEAIEEARRASERCTRATERDVLANALYQQAEIHRLRGELVEAEEAYRRASEFGREPQPGLALLRLAQNRGDAAGSAINRVISTTRDRLQRAGLLPAFIEIMLALGEVEAARVACQELEEIAANLKTDVLGAMAAHARGAIQMTEGNTVEAAESLRRAFQVWQEIGAPYIAARIRVLLGAVCHALGDADSALLELSAARQVFEQLGALPDVARVDALTQKSDRARHSVLTPRELEVLRLVASGKTNKAIAKQLFLSEKTVDRHVSNIFTKVNVASRAAATAYAYEHGLI